MDTTEDKIKELKDREEKELAMGVRNRSRSSMKEVS